MRPTTLARAALMLAAVGLAGPAAAAPATDAALKARIDRLLRANPLIDGHNDLPGELWEKHGSDVRVIACATDRLAADKRMMTDLARLRTGGVGGQFWSVYIDGKLTGDEAIRRTIEQIDIVRRMIAAHPDRLALARTADEVQRIHRSGRTASLIGVEGGRQIGDSLAALRAFEALGARYLTLTHNQSNALADSATDEVRHGGLSPFGRTVIAELNRLGMMVDLSHVSADTMRQAIAASRAPVIFSHSSAFALAPHPRNVPDDVLRLLPANGGVVMINVYSVFLSPAVWDWLARRAGEEARLKAIHRASAARVATELTAWDAANPRPVTDLSTIADHVEHVARVAGRAHVGLGADLDGVDYVPTGFDGVEDYPALLVELARRGWSDRDLAALAGGNVLRVMRAAESVATAMAGVAPAMDKPTGAP